MIVKWVWYLDAPIDRKSPQMHLQPSFSPQGNLNYDDGQRHVKSDMDYEENHETNDR